MRTWLSRGLCSIAIVASLLISCGGEPTDDEAAGALDAYAHRLCGAASTWMEALEVRNSQLSGELSELPPGHTGATRDVIVTFLGGAVDDTETLIDEVSTLPPPDVDGGAQIHQSLLSAFTQARDRFADARDRFSDIDARDTAALAQALNDLATAPVQAGTDIADSVQGLENEELIAALRRTPACARLSA
jgi:hypothetical protein